MGVGVGVSGWDSWLGLGLGAGLGVELQRAVCGVEVEHHYLLPAYYLQATTYYSPSEGWKYRTT